jgi:ligand-binding sensor domain-containing protein
MRVNKIIFISVFSIAPFLVTIYSHAQEIPIGTWRTHISFNSIHTISSGTSMIYAAADNGILIFDQAGNSLSTLTKLDGLSSTNITQVAADPARQQALVGYNDGDLDILRTNEIVNFDRLKNSTTVTGSKRINHIAIDGNFAYLSTDYGLVVFDLMQLEVKETWRDLGPVGEKIKIYQSTFFNDSIFLATEKGVLAGDLNDNLLDFNNWKRFNTGVFNGNIQSIATFNNKVYAAINGSGLHRYVTGVWTQEAFLSGLVFSNLAGGNDLLITEGSNVWSLSSTDVLTEIISDKIIQPFIAVRNSSGNLWIGDDRNGLLSDHSGSFESYIPDGPTFSGGIRMKFDAASKKIYAVSGGFTSSLVPIGKTELLNGFASGDWNAEATLLDKDLTDVEISGNKLFLSSHGYGVQITENGSSTLYDETNSPLVNLSPGRNVRVTALASSSDGVWVTNAGAIQSLHLYRNDNTWESFSFPAVAAARYPVEIAVDYLGNVWMVLNPGNGGGILVFDREGNQSAYLTEVSGAGGLPSRSVYSIAMDRDGQVWIGTAEGVAYFPDPSRVFTTGINAVKPVFENRLLLKDEKVTAIEVDGGNRKWMGTEKGVWLFNAFGEEQIYNFSAENSPLLSDEITDIEINDESGEVFFMTPMGITSFRSTATISEADFNKVKIFPNPVTNHFNGLVGISGLATDATVKITDVSGKLVWQTIASGGTATWDVRDYNGRRAATGMYLVLSTSQDGSESIVGKIAVVD